MKCDIQDCNKTAEYNIQQRSNEVGFMEWMKYICQKHLKEFEYDKNKHYIVEKRK